MPDSYWDDVANEAVDKLAEELAPSLRSALADAMGDALRRLEEEVSRQSGRIDDAAQRLQQAALEIADEISRGTTTAVNERLATTVLPALREEAQRALEAGEEHIHTLLHDAREAVATADSRASKTEEQLMRAVRDNASALLAAVEQSLLPALAALGENVAEVDQRVQAQVCKLTESRAQVDTSLRDSAATLGVKIAEAKEDLARSVERMLDAHALGLTKAMESDTQTLAGTLHPVLAALGDNLVGIDQRVQAQAQELAESGTRVDASLRDSAATLGAKIAEAKDDLTRSIERMLDVRVSRLAKSLETATHSLADSERRLDSGMVHAFGESEKRIAAAERALRAALQSAIKEVNDRSDANASEVKNHAGQRGDGLMEALQATRADTSRLLAQTEKVERTLAFKVEASKTDLVDHLQATARAEAEIVAQYFSSLNGEHASRQAETQRALAMQERLLRQVLTAQVVLTATTSGTLVLVAYHLLP